MSNTQMVEKYRTSFLKEVEANVEEGEWVKMCMQCGVCAGSCPLGKDWAHPPQEIFMMIRAGKRDEVLQSESMRTNPLRSSPRSSGTTCSGKGGSTSSSWGSPSTS